MLPMPTLLPSLDVVALSAAATRPSSMTLHPLAPHRQSPSHRGRPTLPPIRLTSLPPSPHGPPAHAPTMAGSSSRALALQVPPLPAAVNLPGGRLPSSPSRRRSCRQCRRRRQARRRCPRCRRRHRRRHRRPSAGASDAAVAADATLPTGAAPPTPPPPSPPPFVAVERAVGAQEVAEETSNSALITVLVVGAVLLTLIAICVGVMCMNGMFKAAPPSASLAAKVPVEMMPADASSAEVEMAAEGKV